MAKEEKAVIYKIGDRVNHTRRNGVKIKAQVTAPEYPTTKGSWIEIQPINAKGEKVGKTIVCRPTQIKLAPFSKK